MMNQILGDYPHLPVSVQAHFLSDDRFTEDLRKNPALDAKLFFKELRSPLPFHERARLVSHPMERTRIPAILSINLPKTIHYYALSFNPPTTPDEARSYLSAITDPATLAHVYSTIRHLPDLADVFGPHLSAHHLLGYLIDSFSPDLSLLPRAIDQLFSSSRSIKHSVELLTDFFDVHPGALYRYLRAPNGTSNASQVYLAAASSINLTPDLAMNLLTGYRSPLSPISASTELINALVANPVVSSWVLGRIASNPNLARSTRALLTRRARLNLPEIRPGFDSPTREVFDTASWLMRARSMFAPNIESDHTKSKDFHLAWLPLLVAHARTNSFASFSTTKDGYSQPPINGFLVNRLLGPARFARLISALIANDRPSRGLIGETRYLLDPKYISPNPAYSIPTQPPSPALSTASPTAPAYLCSDLARHTSPGIAHLVVLTLGEDLARWDLFAEIIERATADYSTTLGDALRLTELIISNPH